MKKQQRLGKPSVLKSFLATSALLLLSNPTNALQVQSQNMEGLKSSLQSNLNSWLHVGQKQKQKEMSFSQTFTKNKTKHQSRHHKHHKRHHQSNSLNLAQTSSKQKISINLVQLQALLQSQGLDITSLGGQRNDDEQSMNPEIEAALAQQAAEGGAQLSPAEMAQLQAQAEAEVQAQAPPAQAALATAPVEQAAAPQQLSAAEQAQIEAQAQAEASAQMQAPAAGAAGQQAAMLAQAQAQAQAEAMAQVQAQAQAQAQAGAVTGAGGLTQQEMMMAQAQAEAEAQAQMGGSKPPHSKLVVADSDMNNHAAAVAAAADSLFKEEKPWAKMNPAERQAKLAKDAAEKAAKAAKEERENPTVDENGEHIQTVAEARVEAKQLQDMLVAGEAAVEQKIQLDQARMAAEPVDNTPVKQEEDDGHLETVEEAKAKMAAAQKAMDEGIANTDRKIAKQNEDIEAMPNFGALANVHDTLSNMGKMRKTRQVNDLAGKLGVEVKAGDTDMDPQELTNAMMQRAMQAGKSEAEINAALAE